RAGRMQRANDASADQRRASRDDRCLPVELRHAPLRQVIGPSLTDPRKPPAYLERVALRLIPGLRVTEMTNAPQTLTLKDNRDLEGARWQRWLRRALLTLLALLLVAALANAFGQRPATSEA